MEIDLNEWKVSEIQALLGAENVKARPMSTSCDLVSQRVIKADVLRTKIGVLLDREIHLLELLLTHYCKDTHTSYKQGINEIFAPFLLLTRVGLSLDQAYLMGKNFIQLTLLSMFKDATFRPAQVMFQIMKILLRYKNPVISSFLLKQGTTPELYATSWFLTVFATKIPRLEDLFMFWKDVLAEKDPLFVCYVAVAILEKYQEQLDNKQYVNPAQAINRISFQSPAELKEIVESARGIKESMPYSWKSWVAGLDIFNLQRVDVVARTVKEEFCLMMLPREVIRIAYPELKCTCNLGCVWCDKRNRVRQNVVFIDCRSSRELQGGTIPGALVEPKLWLNFSCSGDFVSKMNRFKGNSHIVLIGSEEFLPSGFDLTPSTKPSTDKEMIESLYDAFVSKGFPYVSIVHGGFRKCHELILGLDLEPKDHNPERCLICDPNCLTVNKNVGSRFKKFAKSMSDVIKTGVSKMRTGFSSFSLTPYEEIVTLTDYSDADAYLCRKFDKTTNGQSDEEFSLLVMKSEVLLGRYSNNQPRKIIKTMESIKMTELLKITSMKKFPNVLTFFTTAKQVCVILSSAKESKECITLVTKYFREIRINNQIE